MRFQHLLVVAFLMLAGIAAAPTAAAECTNSDDTTVCSLGEGDDGVTPNNSPSYLPFVPYPCQYDYYCNEGYNWFTP